MPLKIGKFIKKDKISFKYFSVPFLRQLSKILLLKTVKWHSDEVINVPVLNELASLKAISPKREPFPKVATLLYVNIFKLYILFSSSLSLSLSSSFFISFFFSLSFSVSVLFEIVLLFSLL